MQIISPALLGVFILSGCAHDKTAIAATPTPPAAPAAAKPVTPAVAPAAPTAAAVVATATNAQPGLTTLQEKASYGVGSYFGGQLKRWNVDVNMDLVVSAMKDVLAGQELKLTEQQGREAFMAYQQQKQKELAAKNTQEGEVFLAENKKKDGIKTLAVTLPDGKSAEMQYKVISEGTGESPKTNDIVSINYRGTLISGKEFDNSAKRGQPAQFPANRAPIKGFSEVLPMMKTGSKWELYLPSSLAFGERGGMVEPGATVIFEVELVSVAPPAPPAVSAPAQPTTSDIIKVPSAEEMKKGAKIETIKAQDLEKIAAEQNAGSKTNK